MTLLTHALTFAADVTAAVLVLALITRAMRGK